MSARRKCENCGWVGLSTDLLMGPHPFIIAETLLGCPRCLEIDEIVELCDAPDCPERATSGWPSPSGYRRTCHKHREDR